MVSLMLLIEMLELRRAEAAAFLARLHSGFSLHSSGASPLSCNQREGEKSEQEAYSCQH